MFWPSRARNYGGENKLTKAADKEATLDRLLRVGRKAGGTPTFAEAQENYLFKRPIKNASRSYADLGRLVSEKSS